MNEKQKQALQEIQRLLVELLGEDDIKADDAGVDDVQESVGTMQKFQRESREKVYKALCSKLNLLREQIKAGMHDVNDSRASCGFCRRYRESLLDDLGSCRNLLSDLYMNKYKDASAGHLLESLLAEFREQAEHHKVLRGRHWEWLGDAVKEERLVKAVTVADDLLIHDIALNVSFLIVRIIGTVINEMEGLTDALQFEGAGQWQPGG